MKNVLLLSVLALGISFGACKKCADCVTKTTIMEDGQTTSEVEQSIGEYCGKDLKEIDGTSSETSIEFFGVSTVTRIETNCN